MCLAAAKIAVPLNFGEVEKDCVGQSHYSAKIISRKFVSVHATL